MYKIHMQTILALMKEIKKYCVLDDKVEAIETWATICGAVILPQTT